MDKKEKNKIEIRIQKMVVALNNVEIPREVKQFIYNRDPRPYPCITPMSDSSKVRHAILGRRIEVSLLLYQVYQCDCCGRVEPTHIDPEVQYPKNIVFSRSHFLNNVHEAHHCNCKELCRGSQFFSLMKTTQTDWFNQKHKNVPILNRRSDPTAYLCKVCHSECSGKHNTDELMSGRMFSFRNGFGQVQYVSDDILKDNISSPFYQQYLLAQELQKLLLSFTMVEEAAIRTIVPLLSITRLTHGNIATKGNTSCVWEKSKLYKVLPNLPTDYKWIIINCCYKDGKSGESKLHSTTFERRKIQRSLEILQQTVPGVWKNDDRYPDYHIEYSDANLNAWPEKGDICDIEGIPMIFETNNDGKEVPIDKVINVKIQKEDMNHDNQLFSDGNDLGPAPLQNCAAPVETYECTAELRCKSNCEVAKAQYGQKLWQIIGIH